MFTLWSRRGERIKKKCFFIKKGKRKHTHTPPPPPSEFQGKQWEHKDWRKQKYVIDRNSGQTSFIVYEPAVYESFWIKIILYYKGNQFHCINNLSHSFSNILQLHFFNRIHFSIWNVFFRVFCLCIFIVDCIYIIFNVNNNQLIILMYVLLLIPNMIVTLSK